ncbi:MAG: hypothetical protein ABR596_02205 [Halarsenatibacteraceae bacterium]
MENNESKVNLTGREYIDLLYYLYRANFDIKGEQEIAGKNFDYYAFCEIANEKYMGHKSVKIYSYNDYEHCMVYNQVNLDLSFLTKEFFNDSIDELIQDKKNHHQSYLTFILVVEGGVNQAEITRIEDFKLSRSFWFGIRGWVDLRLIVVDLDDNSVYANNEGQDVMENYNPCWLKEKIDKIKGGN